MAQVSKWPLKPKVWQTIWQQLVSLVSRDHRTKQAEILLNGLVTQTEQQVIAKRLMVGILTIHGWNTTQIAEVLHLSTSTTSIHQRLIKDNPNYQQVLMKLYPQIVSLSSKRSPTQLEKFLFDIFNQPTLIHKQKLSK
jgi:hypothetical protein